MVDRVIVYHFPSVFVVGVLVVAFVHRIRCHSTGLINAALFLMIG